LSSIKLPLKETAIVASIKLPLKETVWVLNGFTVSENIVDWKESKFLVTENVKSRIIIEAEMIDKNHIKFKWYGDVVPKVLIYKRVIGDDWGEPEEILDWNDDEYIMDFDSASYEIRILGSNDTGESDRIVFGQHQEYDVDFSFELPINEKYYYFDVNVTSVYRIEVNL
jgi:hypothetical protein